MMWIFVIRCFELGGMEPAAELGLELKTLLSLLYSICQWFVPVERKKKEKSTFC